MDYAFRDLMGRIIEIYQDDLTVFSRTLLSHISSHADPVKVLYSASIEGKAIVPCFLLVYETPEPELKYIT
jgi:hypothetical protein